MKAHTLFCSASDRDVTLFARGATPLPQALARGEAVCLDHGERCTGAACPFCAGRPHAAERAALAHPAPEA